MSSPLPEPIDYCYSSLLLQETSTWSSVHKENREQVKLSYPKGWQLQCFRYLGMEDGFDKLSDGQIVFRVKDAVVRPIRTPVFERGQAVRTAGGECGVVEAVFWHLKEDRPYFVLSLSGRVSGRRYAETDLRPYPDT